VIPISTEDYPTPARRPGYSVLANRKLNETFGVRLSDWETQLGEVFCIGGHAKFGTDPLHYG
jgi:dTDP-4-dehydrorhamnose reductase